MLDDSQMKGLFREGMVIDTLILPDGSTYSGLTVRPYVYFIAKVSAVSAGCLGWGLTRDKVDTLDSPAADLCFDCKVKSSC
jgi:hypothetical protein